ncbi:MAG: hypothetical protein EPN20_07915 [Magnetospirillum sp.]|nr:MAG: hypothetical protein EPN20_07915 [Magnetospirillum sp.]
MSPGLRGREGVRGPGRLSVTPNSRQGTSPHPGGRGMESGSKAEYFVGIDMAKAELVVHVRPTAEAFSVANDDGGLVALVERLKPLAPVVIVLKASGGYESLAAAHLAEAGLPVAVVNPRQTRQFAGAIGRLAKTDQLDAAVLAHFAEASRYMQIEAMAELTTPPLIAEQTTIPPKAA